MSQESSGLKEGQKKVFQGAVIVSLGTLTSRILGLLRDVAMGALFDRYITDAWTVAFRIPNLFRRLFSEGSLSLGLVPVFIEAQGENDEGERLQNLLNGLYSFFILFWGVITLLGLIFSEPIFRFLLADSFELDTAKWELTLRFGRIMLGFIYFICTYAFFAGILNAIGSFVWFAVAPAFLNIFMLFFTFLPTNWFSQIGDGLAWGVLIGGGAQAIFLWLVLKNKNLMPKFQMSSWGRDIWRVLFHILTGLAGVGLFQFLVLLNMYFASGLGEGALSHIFWADRLLEFPLSLVSVSLGTAIVPTLSTLLSKKNWKAAGDAIGDVILINLFLALPASVGLFILAEPIVTVLFKRGLFSDTDVVQTAYILKISALSLIFISLSRVVLPVYFATKKWIVPLGLSLSCLIVHFTAAPWWIQRRGIEGLMLSNLTVLAINAVLLFVGFRICGISISIRNKLGPASKFLIAAGGLGFFLKMGLEMVSEGREGTSVAALIALVIGGIFIYLGLCYVLKSRQVFQLLSYLTSAKDS